MIEDKKDEIIREVTDTPEESLDLTLVKTLLERLPDITAKLKERKETLEENSQPSQKDY